jgi:hypothetical protein
MISATSGWRTTSPSVNRVTPMPRMPSSRCSASRSPDGWPRGRSVCDGSPVTTALAPKPSRVRNIFICSTVVFWASSRMTNASLRVRPRMNASGATSMTSSAIIFWTLSTSSMSPSASYSGRTYGLTFSSSVPGKNPSFSPASTAGPGEDDAPHLLVEQRAHRQRHRQVGLAGAGRADAEDDVVGAHLIDVLLLVGALGRDRPPGARHQHGVGEDRRQLGAAIGRQHLDRAHDVVGREVLALAGEAVELLERRAHDRDHVVVAVDRDLVAAQVELRAGGALDELEPGVVGAAQGLEGLGVVERELVAAEGWLGHDRDFCRR